MFVAYKVMLKPLWLYTTGINVSVCKFDQLLVLESYSCSECDSPSCFTVYVRSAVGAEIILNVSLCMFDQLFGAKNHSQCFIVYDRSSVGAEIILNVSLCMFDHLLVLKSFSMFHCVCSISCWWWNHSLVLSLTVHQDLILFHHSLYPVLSSTPLICSVLIGSQKHLFSHQMGPTK